MRDATECETWNITDTNLFLWVLEEIHYSDLFHHALVLLEYHDPNHLISDIPTHFYTCAMFCISAIFILLYKCHIYTSSAIYLK